MAAQSDSPFIDSYPKRVSLLQSPSNEERTNSTVLTYSQIDQCLQPNSLVSALTDPTYRLPKLDENYHEFSKKMLKNKVLLVPTRLALKRNRGSLQRLIQKSQPTEFESLQMILATQPFINETQIDSLPKETGDINSERLNVSPIQYYSSIPPNLSGRLRHNTAPTDVSIVFKEKPIPVHPVTGETLHHFVEDFGNPSPCSYVLPRKSLRAKNAPAFTFGERCLVEKTGGSRTAWDKQWFAHSNPFTTKVDFNRESVWPTPAHYPAPPALGVQATKLSFPAWSIGTRHEHDPTASKDKTPSPNTYDTIPAFHKLTDKTAQITMKSRPGGTKVSNTLNTDLIPGPGAHDQRHFLSNKVSAPKYSFGKRWPISLGQDPYISTLPSIES